MHASILPMRSSRLPIARIRSIHELFALVPREIRRLLLIVDPADQAESALSLALEIAEHWGSQITLVHSGRLSEGSGTGEQSAETAMIDLLCLSWQVKERYGEVSISKTLPTCPADVLDEAAQRETDLILLPETLAARFRRLELPLSSDSCCGSPCPIVVVMGRGSEWCR
jgi:Universal stress protein family